jgi:hypothetical protein
MSAGAAIAATAGGAVTGGKVVGGEMPSEPKNSGAIAMAPQFLAPCPPYRPPFGRTQGLLQQALLQKLLYLAKRPEVARRSEWR